MTAARRSEPFAAVPRRVFRALEAHELTFAQLGLLACLIDLCAGAERAATLAVLRASTRWPWGDEALRQALHHLAETGWIAAQAPTPGGRSPWRFSILGAQIGALDLEHSSNDAVEEQLAIPVAEALGTSNQAPSHLGPKEEEEDVDKDDDVELIARMDKIGPVGSQRERWLQNLPLTSAWLDALARADRVRSAAAFVDAGVTSGEFPPSPTANGSKRPTGGSSRPLRESLQGWIDGEGRYYSRDAVLDEIDKRERRLDEVLSDADREELLAHWLEVAEA